MANSEMMGKMLAQNRAAAVTSTNFARQLEAFATTAEKNLNDILSIVTSLNKCWQGLSYDNFKVKMTKELRVIRDALPVLRNEASTLYEKARYYEMIEAKLKSVSENS